MGSYRAPLQPLSTTFTTFPGSVSVRCRKAELHLYLLDNRLLKDIPGRHIKKLQHIQTSTARVLMSVTGSPSNPGSNSRFCCSAINAPTFRSAGNCLLHLPSTSLILLVEQHPIQLWVTLTLDSFKTVLV